MARSKASRSRKETKRSAQEWTFLEKALGVIVVVLIVVAAYGFLVEDEVVEVASIETYAATVDLRFGEENASRYSFTRELREGYLFRVRYEVVEEGSKVHFKVWNESRGKTLFQETTLAKYDRDLRIDNEDGGIYDFVWWVEDGDGRSRVEIDVLIQPTERIFEKKT